VFYFAPAPEAPRELGFAAVAESPAEPGFAVLHRWLPEAGFAAVSARLFYSIRPICLMQFSRCFRRNERRQELVLEWVLLTIKN